MAKLNTKQTTWNLTPLFKSDNDPTIEKDKQATEKAVEKFVNKWHNREDYLQDPKILKQALDDFEELVRTYNTDGNRGYYFFLRTMQDQNSPELKAKWGKYLESATNLRNQLQFFELRLAKIPKDKQKVMLKDKQLQPYKHFLEKIFSQAAYQLSEAEERIINLKSDPANDKWVHMVMGFISQEEREVLTEEKKKETRNFEQIISLMSSQNKKVRDTAAVAFNDIMAKYVDIAENEINAILANKKIDDQLRNMPRPDFSRHLGDDIDSRTVDTLLQTVSGRYDIAQRFYKLKAKLLGQTKLAYHERNIEYGKIDKEFSYAEGTALVYKVFQELDPQFAEIFKMFVENGHIDVYPKPGKRSGAFCMYWLKRQPTYLLLNYNNKLRDVTTLAHETGHGINDEFMKKQNALNFGTPTATAEVASQFMEDFVLQEILKTADEETRLAILMAKLNDDVSAIFRQVACYQFEQELHNTFREKGYVSNKDIGQIFQKHMANYMGPAVTQDPGSENWWIYWQHIRMFFYVYSYAGGLLISKSMQNSVKQDHRFIENVKQFLSAGTSDSPKNIFKQMNIDITDAAFWNRGLDEVEKSLKETEKLAKKLGKM